MCCCLVCSCVFQVRCRRVSKIIDVCARLHNLCVDSWLTKKFGADQSTIEETPYPYPRPRLPEVPESYVSQYRSRNVAQTMDEEALEVDLSEMGEYSDQDIAYLVRNGYIHDLPALDESYGELLRNDKHNVCGRRRAESPELH